MPMPQRAWSMTRMYSLRTLRITQSTCTEKRTLRRITLGDAIAADQVFTVLMGEEVEPRREWIEQNAKYVVNLDI